ncbi:MAG: N-acetylmuramoyl-L-alanine amidase family protein [Stackebrandtia sp.]
MPKLYLDPGHGGHDPGAVGNGLEEKDVTLDISLRLRDILEGYDVDIRMSRTTDEFKSLDFRTDDANSWGADFFVSVHINAGGGTGFESFHHPAAPDHTISEHGILHPKILDGMRTVADITDRGKKSFDFHVLRETTMSAILTENLFIDTEADADLLKDADFLNAAAQGHADGLVEILGLQSS